MYSTLADFIAALDSAGELRRVRAQVSPLLEISAIADRVSKAPATSLPSMPVRKTDPRFHDRGGAALLFERVEGSDFPLLINGWGSYQRVEMALGCHAGGHTPGGLEAIAQRLAELVNPSPPRSLGELVRMGGKLIPLLSMPPRRRAGRGACQSVIRQGNDIDLTRLPLIRCWPLDGDLAAVGFPAAINDAVRGVETSPEWRARFRGRYVTFAGIHTIHAEDADDPRPRSHNIGMYRVQLLGPRRMAMHWHLHHDGARHWRSWKQLGKPMPVAIALGGESVLPYAATAPLPPGVSELLLAGFLNRRGIPMVRGVTVPLWVPANAEIVIEGFVSHEAGSVGFDPGTGEALGPGALLEGPFGDHTGFYSMPDRYPVLEVTAVTHRHHAVYPTTIVGPPPQEDYYLGKATERMFLPLLRTLIPDIEDYDLPMFGAFHNCACIPIRKSYALQGRRVMHSVWGAGQMAWTKVIFVVDDDCDVHDTMEVLRRAAACCHPLRDVELVNGPLDILDHAAPRLGAGRKIGFDCTRKIAGEDVAGVPVGLRFRPESDGPRMDQYAAAVRRLEGVTEVFVPPALGLGWMFVRIDKSVPRQGARTLDAIWELGGAGILASADVAPRFVVVLSGRVDVRDVDAALFHWCANFDAGRDLFRWAGESPRAARIGFDATAKSVADGRAGEPVRPWPPLMEFDEATRNLVNRRWKEYGLGDALGSPGASRG